MKENHGPHREPQNQGLLSSLVQIPSQTLASLVEVRLADSRTLLLVSFQKLFQNQCLIVLFVSSSID